MCARKWCSIWSNQMVNMFLPPRDPAILDGLDLTEEERSVLIDNINRRLTPQAVKIRAGNNILWKGNMFFFQLDLMWPTATIPLHPFPSPTCRHRGGMLRIWGHWCSEGSPEGRAELLHRSHAHQGNYHFSLSQPRVCTLMLNDVTLPCLQSWTKETLVFHVVFKPKELPVVTCCFSCIFFWGGGGD